jgi:predicted metal-dependent hydrolase
MSQATRSDRDVPTRRISFDESFAEVPKHFAADGDLLVSHLVASLSAVFPDGEDFFVRSVRHFRDRIEDPALRRQVAGFIGQESVHGREHRAFNRRLTELGYPAATVERFTRKGLALRERIMSPTSNLAATAALEHVTATLAELLLTDPEARRLLGHPAVRDLFVWHALEESEHKAVAFDVYRAVGGSERVRVLTMHAVRVSFVVGMAAQVAVTTALDPASRQPGRLRASWRVLRRSPLVRRALWHQLGEYTRPGFHPDDRDTSALVAQWRDELFGDDGSLNDKLAGTAA